jgi:hypothetical protein
MRNIVMPFWSYLIHLVLKNNFAVIPKAQMSPPGFRDNPLHGGVKLVYNQNNYL